jgi:large subunit ribosomal protein L25
MAKFPGLKVEKRVSLGRKVKQLRRQGIVPANLFGNKIESIAVQVDEKTFLKIFEEVGETSIVEVEVDDKKYPSLITGIARDSVYNKILHIDFHHVSLKEKVTAHIPVELIGESPGVKDLGGVLFQSVNEIEVEALPTDLPESIEVDISKMLNLGDSITIADLKVDNKIITIKAEEETSIVSIQEPAKEEVVEEAPAETEVIGAEPKEGETVEESPKKE